MSSIRLFFSKTRKTFLIVIFALMLVAVPVQKTQAAGMAVMDIQAILTAINNFASTLQQYQRQISQWTAEAQRIATAAKAISEGQYQQGIQGLLASANSVAGNLNTYLGSSTGLEIMQAINSGYEWGIDMRDFSDLLDQSTDELESLYGNLDFSNSSGWDVVNDVLDTTLSTVDTVGYVTNRGIDAVARNTATVVGESVGAINQASGLSDRVREAQEKLSKNQQEMADKYNELQRAISRGEESKAEGLRVEISTIEEENDLLMAELEGYQNQLKMALDAEDQMLAQKTLQLARTESMLRATHQSKVINAMQKVAEDDQTWMEFVEEVYDKYGDDVYAQRDEVMLESLEDYYAVMKSKKAETAEASQGNN